MSPRKNKPRMSYVEVESDVDLDSEDEKVKVEKSSQDGSNKGGKGVGDTYGTEKSTKSAAKKSRRNTKKKNDEDESPYTDKLLIGLPFDLFAEICSNLDGKDLINISKTNKTLRSIMLSRSSRSIWSACRKAAKLPLLDGLSEIQTIVLLDGDRCFACGEPTWRGERFDLRVRLCHPCRKQHIISSKKLRKQWPDLHPSAVHCVRFVDDGLNWSGTKSLGYSYLVSDLSKVDSILKDLEEEDEIAQSQYENRKFASGTRSRQRQGPIEAFESQLDSYTAMRREWVAKEQAASRELVEAVKGRKDELDREREERWAREEEQLRLLRDVLTRLYGWTRQEADQISTYDDSHLKESPATSPALWIEYRKVIQKEIAKYEIAHKTRQREKAVYPYYKDLREEAMDADERIFPDCSEFLRFANVKPLFKPEDAVLNDETWQQALPLIREEIDLYQQKARMEAIRRIVSITQGIELSTLSQDLSDYNETTYGDDFFLLATSMFTTCRYVNGDPEYTAGAFLGIVKENQVESISSVLRGISIRQVSALKIMMTTAGLDESTTTFADLWTHRGTWSWTNAPMKWRREIKYRAIRLVHVIVQHGPSNRKVKEGQLVELIYHPADQHGADEGDSDDDEDDIDEDVKPRLKTIVDSDDDDFEEEEEDIDVKQEEMEEDQDGLREDDRDEE